MGQFLDAQRQHIRLCERDHDETIRQTGILEQVCDHLEALPSRIAAQPGWAAPTATPVPISGLRDLADSLRRLIGAALPIILLALLAAGKISWRDLIQILMPALLPGGPAG